MIVFVDNDILLKLSACDLLSETIAALRCTNSDVRVLQTARFVFQHNRRVGDRYSEQGRLRAIAFVNCCQSVGEDNSDEFELLQVTDGIDIGEARLLAATQGLAIFLLMTGDKNCLASLGSMPGLEVVKGRVEGRVVCLEQVMLLLIQSLGFDLVKARVVPVMECDQSLKACFGSGVLAIEENVIVALEGYIETLRQAAPGLLADLSGF